VLVADHDGGREVEFDGVGRAEADAAEFIVGVVGVFGRFGDFEFVDESLFGGLGGEVLALSRAACSRRGWPDFAVAEKTFAVGADLDLNFNSSLDSSRASEWRVERQVCAEDRRVRRTFWRGIGLVEHVRADDGCDGGQEDRDSRQVHGHSS
jgi:hypothetical protein